MGMLLNPKAEPKLFGSDSTLVWEIFSSEVEDNLCLLKHQT